jgi:hypothetical protein
MQNPLRYPWDCGYLISLWPLSACTLPWIVAVAAIKILQFLEFTCGCCGNWNRVVLVMLTVAEVVIPAWKPNTHCHFW